MNKVHHQEIYYRLLNLLADKSRIGQRDMAREMGISVGKVNYCITELATKGLIKIKRFKNTTTKLPYAYLLTPHGMEEKGESPSNFSRENWRNTTRSNARSRPSPRMWNKTASRPWPRPN
jgi:EPS-associated MarR family transcriptional regulator